MCNDFEQKVQRLWKKLGTHSVMTLSTSADNRVSSRPVSVVISNGNFYFQTSNTYLKFKQLLQNPNASFCVNNYSVEGKCECLGKPSDICNAFFIKLFKKYFFASCKAYSSLPEERLFKFTPSLIYSWNYEFTKPFMEYWDFKNKIYKREYK